MTTKAFQQSVRDWTVACFGASRSDDKNERNHRFLEEAIELAQAGGCPREEAELLLDYVYNRPPGAVPTEIGDTLNTLAALANAHRIDMTQAGETVLAKCWFNIDKIRAKADAKPKFGPLPGATPTP